MRKAIGYGWLRSRLALATMLGVLGCVRQNAGVQLKSRAGLSTSEAIVEYPQYIGVRIAGSIGAPHDTPENRARCGNWPTSIPFEGNDYFCVRIDLGLVDRIPNQSDRRWAIGQGFKEIRDKVMNGSSEAFGRSLATEVILSTLDISVADQWKLFAFLDDLLAAVMLQRMPLLINLDTVNWINGRPDVYQNLANVEASVSEDVQISWRNWGNQIRILPAPNLAGAGFREANQAILLGLLPKLADFYASLAPQDRYLYAGLVFGTEISVGVNAYYYHGGNTLLQTTDTACDPGMPWQPSCPNFVQGLPPPPIPVWCGQWENFQCLAQCGASLSMGVEQIGYKAARTLDLLDPTDPVMTRGILDRIVLDYISFLNHLARYSSVPTHKIMAHVGGQCGPNGPHSLGDGRLASVFPSWSLYGLGTQSPGPALGPYIESTPELRTLPWATPEWQPYGAGSQDASHWTTATENTANYFNSRAVILANWDTASGGGYGNDPGALAGLRQVLAAPRSDFRPATPTLDLGHATFRNSGGQVIGVGLKASSNPTSGATYLNVSTSLALNSSGLLETVDVANAELTPGSSYILSRAYGGTAYVQLVTDVSGATGVTKRIQSPLVPLELVPGIGGEVPYPRLFTRVEGGLTTFSWDTGDLSGALRHAEYLNASTDPTFELIDTINSDVTGVELYSRAIAAGQTVYARLVMDVDRGSGVVRTFSNIETVTP